MKAALGGLYPPGTVGCRFAGLILDANVSFVKVDLISGLEERLILTWKLV
jgi:hypothetical protein